MDARILIADDSLLLRTSLKQLLESHCGNWRVCGFAANGRQAVQKARELQPDLIILDLKLPLMDGIAASVAIRKLLPRVPIVMYTLYKSPELDAKARRAGVREVVSKSDPATLLEVTAELLGTKKMAAFGGSS